MRKDHVLFDPVQGEIAVCVLKRAFCMDEAVKTVGSVARMPVVKEIIVQKCASYKRGQVGAEGKECGDHHAHHGHSQRMLIYADCAVLTEAFFKRHSAAFKYIAAETENYFACL